MERQTFQNYLNIYTMAKRTYTIEKKDPTHNQVWEWNETPELAKLIKELHTNKSIPSTGSNNPVV